RSSLSFTLESSERLSIIRHVFWQKLQSDEAMQASIFGFIDNTHPATTQFFKDSIMRDGLPNHSGESLWSGATQVNEGEELGCTPRNQLALNRHYAHPMKGDVKEKNSLPSPRGKPGRGDIQQPCLLIRGAFDVAALDRRVIQRRCQPQLIIQT